MPTGQVHWRTLPPRTSPFPGGSRPDGMMLQPSLDASSSPQPLACILWRPTSTAGAPGQISGMLGLSETLEIDHWLYTHMLANTPKHTYTHT